MSNIERVSEILYHSFYENGSTKFVVKQDTKRDDRLKLLIRYSIWNAEKWGQVLLNEQEDACLLLIYPHKKKFSLKAILWDVRLAFGCIGLKNLKMVMKHENALKSQQPKKEFIYVWYLGVAPDSQGRGRGTALMKSLQQKAAKQNLPIFLETSMERNYPFYEKLGFKATAELNTLKGLKTFLWRP